MEHLDGVHGNAVTADDFPVRVHADPRTPAARRAALDSQPKFGDLFTDHMALAQYTPEAGWHDREITALAPFSLHPATSVLHYGQAIFEGLKAYATPTGGIALFRPAMNAKRFALSARRMAMPELPEDLFIASLQALVRTERDWVPTAPGTSLYLRPMMFARDPAPADEAVARLHLRRDRLSGRQLLPQRRRAGDRVDLARLHPRGTRRRTGEAKFAGNYAASYAAQAEAAAHGCDQVVWLDAIDRSGIEEMGG